MKRVLILFILIPFLFSCGKSRLSEEAEKLLDEGDELFRTALESDEPRRSEFFSRAAIVWEQAAREGDLENGYLYYNIGNSWMNAGKTGEAVLYLRKALELIPGNKAVKNNLSYARDTVKFQVKGNELNPLLKTLLFFHYDFSGNLKYVLLIVSLFILSGSASFFLFFRRPELKVLMTAAGAVALLFFGSLLVMWVSPEQGVVLRESAGRKGDSMGYEPSFTEDLPPGIEFSLVERRTAWLYIQLSDGRNCWIPEDNAGMIE